MPIPGHRYTIHLMHCQWNYAAFNEPLLTINKTSDIVATSHHPHPLLQLDSKSNKRYACTSTNHNHFTTTTVLRPFFWDHPGEPVPRKLLLDFMVLGRITRGRHTNNLGRRHSIQTNQQSISINPPHF